MNRIPCPSPSLLTNCLMVSLHVGRKIDSRTRTKYLAHTHTHTQPLNCGSAVQSFRQIFLVRLVFDYRLYASLLCPFLQQTHTQVCICKRVYCYLQPKAQSFCCYSQGYMITYIHACSGFYI